MKYGDHTIPAGWRALQREAGRGIGTIGVLRALSAGCLCLLALLFVVCPGYAQDSETTVRLDGRALFRVSNDSEITSETRATRVRTAPGLASRKPRRHSPGDSQLRRRRKDYQCCRRAGHAGVAHRCGEQSDEY